MIDVDVVLVLPAIPVQPLPEVPLVVVQPDANERDPEIGGTLDVITGKDSQAVMSRNSAHRPPETEFQSVR